ncbi:AMP-binding protein [Comamonas endophytica]|uniref:AMP-binding protein n=3 Tax=Comamonas endophytica TaxID=2949090 RepID=A0ABY6G7D4_9BURK|nr:MULTISPECIES: AMP-binding protein [unclassified Acidovorax]MCD2511432.1 AMP-binding protein [Acidovorax sp. D4N7]UYG50823.1 AMP-binding protein [Acidovorax sp. 5MLIR]
MVPSLVFGDQHWSRPELALLAERISRSLNALGVGEGDTVAVMLRNSPSYVATVIACKRAGVYLVSLNWHFKAGEVRFLLEDSGAQVLVVHEDLVEPIRAGVPAGVALLVAPLHEDAEGVATQEWPAPGQQGEPLPDSPRVPFNSVVYTSGTTGRPKGVRRLPVAPEARARVDAEAAQVAKTVYGTTPESVALLSAPMYHSATMSFASHACAVGATLVLEPGFDAERTLQLIEQHRVTHAYLVPTMYQRLLALPSQVRAKYDIRSLVQVSSTGSPCARGLKQRMIDWLGPVVTEAYGSSEAGYTTFITAGEWLAKPGSAGRALGSAQLAIVGEGGEELPPGEIGLIYVRQPAMPDFTYIGREEDRRGISRDGLVTLGDMGFIDEDGYLFICDRKSDMVISGGVNIYPAEIEACILAMDEVGDVAVFGIPDAEFGEALAAAVQLKPGRTLDAATIGQRLREKIANYKIPRTITFHDALPREDTGKIFKRLLREPYWAGADRRI